jgi:predicted ATP-grasp superfamily ATP-dependent carboligase
MPTDLLIVGASARAAAESALRAGMRPWCADLFADADLQALCPVVRVPRERYPRGLVEAVAGAPQAPFVYTGALENRPALVRQLAALRPLWGNSAGVLRRVRQPWAVAAALRAAGLPVPMVRRTPPRRGRWLVKPLAGAGGRGIAEWDGTPPRARCYFQEFIEGTPCAAVYVGDGTRALLLGVTRQLIGEPWLHAKGFQYCGSVGPLAVPLGPFVKMGDALAAAFGLRGLFGVDCVLRDGVPYPVEVNPRYTASVEVLERATGVRALDLHCAAFTTSLPAARLRFRAKSTHAKAIFFAPAPLTFPPGRFVRAADLPHAGAMLPAGAPILTLFSEGASVETCLAALRRRARRLDRRLAGR